MKELSIEEKAKAYDKAIERAKYYYSTTDSAADIKLIGLMFPELKESEDEKIRKEILDYIINGSESLYDVQQYGKERFEKWIAWLEKQADHAKFRESIQVGDQVTRNEDGVLVNLSQLNRVAKKDEKQGEQKSYISETMEEKHDFDSGFTKMMEKEQKPNPCENCGIATNNCQKFPCAIRDGEQKPAECSEKDEINLEKAIWYVENPAPMVVKDSMLVEWLKNLRGRVQPKQEWSEEDNELMKWSIINLTELKDRFGEEYGKVSDCINWLKSLRPNHWKPSDEQMKILNEVLNFAANHESPHWNDYIFGTLNNLIRQLKKLREE